MKIKIERWPLFLPPAKNSAEKEEGSAFYFGPIYFSGVSLFIFIGPKIKAGRFFNGGGLMAGQKQRR